MKQIRIVTPDPRIYKDDRTGLSEWSSSQLISCRKSIRLKGYDYSTEGAYFITICTYKNKNIFGNIINDIMTINEYGEIVVEEWLKTEKIRKEVELDVFTVMPNHFHAIILLHGRGDRPVAPTQSVISGPRQKSIGALVAGFKSTVTKRINMIRHTPGIQLWQRNYYDHVIRNDTDMNRIREYIINNSANWEIDDEFRVESL